jgi:hypothetical protein
MTSTSEILIQHSTGRWVPGYVMDHELSANYPSVLFRDSDEWTHVHRSWIVHSVDEMTTPQLVRAFAGSRAADAAGFTATGATHRVNVAVVDELRARGVLDLPSPEGRPRPMLAGQYVVHEGTICQVLRISGPARGYGTPEPYSLYELQVVGSTEGRTLLNPSAADIPMTPACEVCELPAGFAPCGAGQFPHRAPKRQIA